MEKSILLLLVAASSLHATVLHHPVATTETVYECLPISFRVQKLSDENADGVPDDSLPTRV